MNKLFAFSLLAALISVPAALAAAPKMVFDASYECTGPAGTNSMRMISDGKGHMRTETNAAGQQVINLVDYPGKESTTLMVNRKMAMRMPFRETTEVYDVESAKRANAKDLGTKDVDGHKCHGFEYSNEQAKQTVWIGDDTHYLVYSECELKGGKKMTMKLKSWSTKAPSADAFAVPQGYTEMKMPTAASMMPPHHK